MEMYLNVKLARRIQITISDFVRPSLSLSLSRSSCPIENLPADLRRGILRFSRFTSRTFDRRLTIRWNRRLNVQLRTPCAVKRRERPRIVGSNDRAKQQRGGQREFTYLT